MINFNTSYGMKTNYSNKIPNKQTSKQTNVAFGSLSVDISEKASASTRQMCNRLSNFITTECGELLEKLEEKGFDFHLKGMENGLIYNEFVQRNVPQKIKVKVEGNDLKTLEGAIIYRTSPFQGDKVAVHTTVESDHCLFGALCNYIKVARMEMFIEAIS